jgi:PTH1 family peptidyl-tRNA hydrolase
MHLLVGLGNPGPRYARHRHNIGFMAVEAIAARHRCTPFRARGRFAAELAEGSIGTDAVLLAKPTTYMNESGQAVGALVQFHKLAPAEVIVFYDELDLAAGKVRVKRGGGAAGHNGIRSIDAHIGNDFWRVRLGIGHPGARELVTHHVLSEFTAEDRAWLEPLLEAVAEACPLLIRGEDNQFMSKVAQRLAPPKPAAPPPGGTERPE